VRPYNSTGEARGADITEYDGIGPNDPEIIAGNPTRTNMALIREIPSYIADLGTSDGITNIFMNMKMGKDTIRRRVCNVGLFELLRNNMIQNKNRDITRLRSPEISMSVNSMKYKKNNEYPKIGNIYPVKPLTNTTWVKNTVNKNK